MLPRPVADRVEVRVVSRHPSAVLAQLDRRTKVLDSVGRLARDTRLYQDPIVGVQPDSMRTDIEQAMNPNPLDYDRAE